MGMMINRRRAYGGKSLPYDAEIEWLECNGGQYIENFYTENSITQVLVFAMELQATGDIIGNASSYQNGSKIIGIRDDNKHPFAFYKPTGVRILLEDVYTTQNIINFDAGFSKTSGKFSISVNGRTPVIGNYSGLVSNESYTLFSRNNPTATSYLKGKFYYIKISEDGVLVKDCIPVRVGQVGYMYDKVSNQLFGNSGTGNFILGPDK